MFFLKFYLKIKWKNTNVINNINNLWFTKISFSGLT